jgi:hypothetical protein
MRRRRLDLERLTFSRGLLIALGSLMFGAALGWTQPPAWIIVFVGLVGVLFLLRGLRTLETPSPCGNPRVRLERLKGRAKHLEHELENFDKRREAVRCETFNDKVDGRRETHAEAMRALFWAFGAYFSASYTYEDHCTSHHGRRQRRLLKRLEAVYNALGLDPGGDTDEPLKSGQLHIIAQRSTKQWGEAEADFLSEADFDIELKENPAFGAYFDPIRFLLMRAADDDGAEARARLKKAEEAVRAVKVLLEGMLPGPLTKLKRLSLRLP